MTCPRLAFPQLCYPLHSFVKNHTKVVREAGREQQELCSFFCTITALSPAHQSIAKNAVFNALS